MMNVDDVMAGVVVAVIVDDGKVVVKTKNNVPTW